MNKFTLLAGASVFAIGVGNQAAAVDTVVVSTLAALCGATVSVDTMVAGTVEDFTETLETCGIELSGGAVLSIKDASFTFADEFSIDGDGTVDIANMWMAAKAVQIALSSGNVFIRDSHLDLEEDSTGAPTSPILDIRTGAGNIDLRNNDFSAHNQQDDANINIETTMGDIALVENAIAVDEDLRIEAVMGNVEFKGNTGVVGETLKLEGDDVTVKGNSIAVANSIRLIAAGDLEVKGNNFGSPGLSVSVVGSCNSKDNIPEIECP